MSGFTATEPSPGHLVLAGDLRIAHAQGVHAALRDGLMASARLDVDLLDVSAADVSTVQTLLFVSREATRLDKEVRWLGFAPPIADLVHRLGLGATLGEPAIAIWE